MAREPGDRIIPKLIPVIRDTIIATKRGLAGHERSVRAAATQDVIDKAGREVADLYRPFVDKLLAADDGTLSDDIKQHLKSAASGEHQLQALSGLLLGPVSGALGTLISNELAPVVYQIVGSNPNLNVDPSNAAAAAARGIISYGDAANAAHLQGYDTPQFNIFYRLAQAAPDPATLWQIVNRNQMTEAQASHWLKHNGYDDSVIQVVLNLRKQVLSPADAALAVLRNNMSHSEGVTVSGFSGVDAHDFEILIGNTGEPPGIQDMLSMLRRGIIDRQRLERGILQSRVRNEWIPFIEETRFQPMTTADAIDANVQNHLSEAAARLIAQENGLRPQDFDPLRQTAGEPLSKTEMLRLFRQGKVTRGEVEQALRESRLKDKYINHALELSVQIPPLFTIRALLASGSISDADATRLMREDGYQDFVIKAIIHTAHKVKTVKARELTEGMLSTLYTEQAITAEQFRAQLKDLGYSPAEAAQIQQIDDWRIAKTNRDNAINHVRSAFIAHKIDESQAQNELHQLLVPALMVEKLMADWKLERTSAVHLLTPAQLIAAWKLGLLDTAKTLARLVNLGYSGADAGLLIEIANKGPLAPGQ